MEKGLPGLAGAVTPKHRLVLVAATIAMALAALDIDLPSAALPKIAADLQGVTLLGDIFTLYLVSSVIGMLLFGRLSDHYGRKPLFLGGISIFMLGCMLAAGAPTLWFFLASRALQGLGAGALPPLAMVIAADLIPDDGLLGRTQGVMNSVWGVSGALGPLVGGAITDSLSWRGIFLFILPIAALAMGLVATFFREEHQARQGDAAASPRKSPGDAGGWRFLLAPAVLAGYVASLLFGAVILLLFAYLPLFIQGVMWQGTRESGVVLAAVSISWSFSGIAAGVLMKRLVSAIGWAMLVGVALVVAAWVGLLRLLQLDTPFEALVPVALLLGLGGGLFNTPSVVIIPRLCPASWRGLANALVEATFSIGGALGVFAAGLIFQIRVGPRADAYSRILLDAHARGLLLPQQARVLASQVAGGLHGVYVLACVLAGGLFCATCVLSTTYGKRKEMDHPAERQQ